MESVSYFKMNTVTEKYLLISNDQYAISNDRGGGHMTLLCGVLFSVTELI